MTEREDNRTLAELASEALTVQDACNLVAVMRSGARALLRLMRLQPHTNINEHPIAKLWADKISHLAGIQDERACWCSEAYSAVYRMSLPGTGGSAGLRLAAAEVAAAEQVSP